MVPRAVLMKSGLVSINTARQNISKTAVLVNTARQVNVAHSKTTMNAARPMPYLTKTTHSTGSKNVNTARQASASITLKKFDYIDAQGRSNYFEELKHMLLLTLKSVKPKVKANVVEEPSVPVIAASTKNSAATTTTTTTISTPRKEIVITTLAGTSTTTINNFLTTITELLSKEESTLQLKDRRKRNKTMITYLKNMEGWKHKDLKSKGLIYKEFFDKAFKRMNMFVDYRIDLVEETTEVDDDQEATKIKEIMEIIPDEQKVAIDTIHLATKPPTIVDWKIYKEGKKNYY
ncbi:hypothetical protein Tco_1068739 [Tanacetum coccineum]|uniref:Uncharacterized protein n=1 Tax=Tanacetum coccineum TaxID=301880 RepID=A0ABQ5HIF5_9ASTR